MLSFLLLIVLIAVMAQLKLATDTERRVAENDVSLTAMDLAIESALMEVYEQLKADGEASGGGEGAEADAGMGDLTGGPPGGGAGGEGGSGAVDSREDEWARPARTTIADVDLRILVQDEDSKINVLALASRDEDVADEAFARIMRVIEFFRADSSEEVDRVNAERMVQRMRDALLERRRLDDQLPVPMLLTDNPADRDRSMLLSLRELVAYEPFHPGLFRDYRDEDARIVHSLTSYLTVYSSVMPIEEVDQGAADAGGAAGEGAGQEGGAESPDGAGAGGQGEGGGQGGAGQGGAGQGEETIANGPRGYAVNINTAPPVVLKALMENRDVRLRFWDEVITYRNEEEEPEGDDEDIEPVYDEYGEEIVQKQIFDSLDELTQIDGWLDIDGDVRERLLPMLTVESHVFSIFVTARMKDEGGDLGGYTPRSRAEARLEEDRSGAITRTVRSVVWRREGEDGWEIVPIVRWEVLDYAPYEVLDDPDGER